MTDSWIPVDMIEKFETMDSVQVTSTGSVFTCIIDDVAACADKMNISEEMLGYVIGALYDSSVDVEFDSYACILIYDDFSERLLPVGDDDADTNVEETSEGDRDVEAMLERFADAPIPSSFEIVDLCLDSGTYMYILNINTSEFWIIYNPADSPNNTEGETVVGVMPYSSSSEDAVLSDLAEVCAAFVWAVDGTVDLNTAIEYATEAIENGSYTINGFRYEYTASVLIMTARSA